MKRKKMKKIDPELFNRFRQILVEITGNEAEEVLANAHLEDDLGMNLDEDMGRLIDKINEEFEIELDEHLAFDELTRAGESVASLFQLVYDELELG